jgi:predicted small secreted protein
MKNMTPSIALVSILAAASLVLSACGPSATESGAVVQDVKAAAVGAAGSAAKAVGEVIDTKVACQIAGQSEVFCGCLQKELGPQLKAEHIDAFTAIVKASIDGSIGAAVKTATSIDPETRDGLVACAARSAISEAIGGQ